MKKKGKIIMSIMLCIVLFVSMLVVPVPMNVIADGEGGELEYPPPPDEDEPTPPEIKEYNLTLSDIRAFSASEYPDVIFTNTPTDVNITFSNEGEGYITDVMVDVYEVKYTYTEPDPGNLPRDPYTKTEIYLTTLSYGGFMPMMGKTQTLSWTPIEPGRHTLRLRIGYTENGLLGFEYSEEVSLCVARHDLPIIVIDEDWIVEENISMDNVTIIVNGDLVITETGGLTLHDCYLRPLSIDILPGLPTFWVNTDVDVHCSNRGDDYIRVHAGATLYVWGSTIFNFLPRETYHFYVDGQMHCAQWGGRWTLIMHVWGLQDQGGIELRNTIQASTFQRTIVRECDTVGIGCYDSSPRIFPYVVLEYCGGHWDYGIGAGLYAEGTDANPWIERCWVRNNHPNYPSHGIKLNDEASAYIVQNWIYDNTYTGIYCYHSSPVVTISSNIWITDNFYGILCWFSSPTIENNMITTNIHGIRCYRSASPIQGNTISDNYYGILCYGTSSPNIESNTIISNRYLGIYMSNSSPTIQNNDQISYNSNSLTWHNFGGIYGWYSTPTIIGNNIVSNYGWGIWMQCGAITNEDTIGTDNTYGDPENTNGRVWQEWRLRVRTADADGGFVAGAYVEVENLKTDIVWTGTSGSTGYTTWIMVTEYKIPNDETSRDFYTPHTIRAEIDLTSYEYIATKLETMDDNKVVEVNFVFRRFAILMAPCWIPIEEQGFKNDISKMRDFLINKGWLDANIWFLTVGTEPYVDGDATYTNVLAALDDIESRSSDQDIVFIQAVDHGVSYRDAYGDDTNYGGRLDGSGGDPVDENDDSYCSVGGGGDSKDPAGNDYDGALCTKEQRFYDDEFADELNDIICRFLVLVPVISFAGEFIEDCSNDFTSTGRIINTAAPENDFAYWNPPEYTYYAYYFHEGLTWTPSLGTNNPDEDYGVSNNNGKIEIEEAHAYADEYDPLDEPKVWDWLTSNNLYLP